MLRHNRVLRFFLEDSRDCGNEERLPRIPQPRDSKVKDKTIAISEMIGIRFVYNREFKLHQGVGNGKLFQ